MRSDGPTHRRYDRHFRYLGRFDRDGNRVEIPEEEEPAPLECPACGCRHFLKIGEQLVCRYCGRRAPHRKNTSSDDEKRT